jgi:hypothetical protein
MKGVGEKSKNKTKGFKKIAQKHQRVFLTDFWAENQNLKINARNRHEVGKKANSNTSQYQCKKIIRSRNSTTRRICFEKTDENGFCRKIQKNLLVHKYAPRTTNYGVVEAIIRYRKSWGNYQLDAGKTCFVPKIEKDDIEMLRIYSWEDLMSCPKTEFPKFTLIEPTFEYQGKPRENGK